MQRHIIENAKQIIPGKERRGYSPNSYIHVSVSELYIPLTGQLLLQPRKISGPNVGIYRSLTGDT
jgi:hypothetical protein